LFATVAVPFEAFQDLPPPHFKYLAGLCRFANRDGECCPSQRQLARDLRISEATASRIGQWLEDHGCFTRTRRAGNGRYFYKIDERFLPRWPKTDSPAAGLAPAQVGLSQRARQEANPLKHVEEARVRARFAKSPRKEGGGLPDDESRWRARVRHWLRNPLSWPADAGPNPNEPGCWVPQKILDDMLPIEPPTDPEEEEPMEPTEPSLPTDTVLDKTDLEEGARELLKAIYLKQPGAETMRADGFSDTEIVDTVHEGVQRGLLQIEHHDDDTVRVVPSDTGRMALGMPSASARLTPQQEKAKAKRRHRRKLFRR
jgi:hypothetical protein